MAQNIAYKFYSGRVWRRCRDAFIKSKCYVCERCGRVATIVHHRQPITPENIGDPNITLNWDNLEAVCLDCHNAVHGNGAACSDEVMFDGNGNLIKK